MWDYETLELFTQNIQRSTRTVVCCTILPESHLFNINLHDLVPKIVGFRADILIFFSTQIWISYAAILQFPLHSGFWGLHCSLVYHVKILLTPNETICLLTCPEGRKCTSSEKTNLVRKSASISCIQRNFIAVHGLRTSVIEWINWLLSGSRNMSLSKMCQS